MPITNILMSSISIPYLDLDLKIAMLSYNDAIATKELFWRYNIDKFDPLVVNGIHIFRHL